MKAAKGLLKVVVPTVLLSVGGLAAQSPEEWAGRVRKLELLVETLQNRVEALEAERLPRSVAEGSAEAVAPREKGGEPGALRLTWQEGVQADSPSRSFQFRFGGRLLNDWAFMTQGRGLRERFPGLVDGSEFRRARLHFRGILHERIEFKSDYDFASSGTPLKDLYFGLLEVPLVGAIHVGHMKEPFGLEELTSSNYLTFMERSLPNVLVPSRNLGLRIQNQSPGGRLTWALGVFRDADSLAQSRGEGNYGLTGRLTGLPWFEDEGRRLVHLGISYSRRRPSESSLRIRQGPESHLAPRLLDTGNLRVDSMDLANLESALIFGPFSLQGELTRANLRRSEGRDASVWGGYVQGSYFLSGEHRSYSRSAGSFSRVRPRNNVFDGSGGLGAWEVAFRYSHLDLNDREVAGGELNGVTFGLNWHLNPNSRIMWNTVFSDLEEAERIRILQMRLQLDF